MTGASVLLLCHQKVRNCLGRGLTRCIKLHLCLLKGELKVHLETQNYNQQIHVLSLYWCLIFVL